MTDTDPSPLAELIEIKHGFAFEGQYFSDTATENILVTPGNFAIGGGFQVGKEKYYSGPIPREYVLQPGDLIVTMTDLSKAGDTLGYPALIPNGAAKTYLHNQRVGRVSVTVADRLDKAFLYYALCGDGYRHHVLGSATGSTVKHTSPSRIREYRLVLPPIENQRTIAAILGSLDDKIEQNRRTGRKLEELARAVFKAWFVDFEPVKAKAAGATAFPGMPPAAFAALPTRFVEFELGPIPVGWKISPIGDVVTVMGGGTPSTKNDAYWTGGTHHWVTPKDFSNLSHPVMLDSDRRITDAGLAKISSGLLPIDTVLMSSRAPVGYLALAKIPTAINQGFIAIQCDGALQPHFVIHWLASVMEEIKSRASGTTFAEISKTAFRPIPVVVPDAPIIEAFECYARPVFDLITQGVVESAKLAALRDYLLPRLLSGKVRVGGL